MTIYTMRSHITTIMVGLMIQVWPVTGCCWGDEGHEIVGLIAERYLTPAVRERVNALLSQDPSGLTRTTGIADEATWADKYRDSDRNTTQMRYRQTYQWHFVDIELDRPDVDAACFHHPPLPPGGNASDGPPDDCILDKIDQFRRELHGHGTAAGEKRLALQFLLHLVGDLHQPLHAADNHDRGGNDLLVKAGGSPAGNLHHYWDTVFVKRLGTRPADVARRLIADISPAHRRMWSTGSPRVWGRQSFEIGRTHVYGPLQRAGMGAGAHVTGDLILDARYEADATAIVAVQLQRAGLRLAVLVNEAMR